MAFGSSSAKRNHLERPPHAAPHFLDTVATIAETPKTGEKIGIERTQALVEELLRVAEDADRLSDEAAKIEHIPLPIRASITDRVAQLSYYIRLLARQVDVHGEKTMNVRVDG
jgi:hypothetical protein